MAEKIYFSNCLEKLLEKLKIDILKKNNFSCRKIIFVPSSHIKDWILKEFSLKKIFPMVRFVNIYNLTNFFSSFLIDKEKFFPNSLDINLAIEQKLLSLLKEKKYVSLEKFLKRKGKILENRVFLLSDLLTDLFFKYGFFSFDLKLTGWQEEVFFSIFQEKCTFLSKEFLAFKNIEVFQDFEFYFFHISFIPKAFKLFLSKLKNSIFYYVFSFSSLFWQDFLSNKERKITLKKYFYNKKNFEYLKIIKFLKEDNFILANFGKLQREFLKILDFFEDMEIIEDYNLQKDWLQKSHFNISYLDAFKQDMLFIRDIEKKYEILEKEDSITICEATSKLREVQILFDYIIKIVLEKNYNLSDILVLSFDIDKYVPYIHMVFGSSKLQYKIDNFFEKKTDFEKGVLTLFSLVNSRWEKERLLDLFENPFFQRKHLLSSEEVEILKSWFYEANIEWGLNVEHKKKKLKKEEKALFFKSFDHGIKRIFNSFIFEDADNKMDFMPPLKNKEISFSKIELFEKFIKIFENLKKDIFFLEEDFYLDAKKWTDIIFSVVEKNFFFEKENSNLFQDFLKKLFCSNEKFPIEIGFNTIYRHLQKAFSNKKASFNKKMVDAILFASLKKKFFPAKVICVLGMDENFPRKDFSSLNILKNYFPSKEDKDRHNFLLAIFLAKNFLYISFTNENHNLLSSMALEFLYYLKTSFSIKKEIQFSHPPFPFDKKYFMNKNLITFSKKNYEMAKQHYLSEKDKRENFFFSPIKAETKEVIDIKDLTLLSSNPIKFYFQKVLNIYLEDEKEKKEIFLSHLDKYLLKTESKSILSHLEKKGFFPDGHMKYIAKEQIINQQSYYQKRLEDLNIDKKNIFDLFFPFSSKESSFNKKSFKKIKIFKAKEKIFDVDGQKIKIVGTINNMSFQGFIFDGKYQLMDLLKAWPKILLYLNLSKKKFSSYLFCLKSNKKIDLSFIDAKEAIVKFLQYYKRCLKEPSFMIRDWAVSVLKNKKFSFEKDREKYFLSKDFQGFEDPYIKKMFLSLEKEDFQKEIFCQDYLKDVFKDLIKIC